MAGRKKGSISRTIVYVSVADILKQVPLEGRVPVKASFADEMLAAINWEDTQNKFDNDDDLSSDPGNGIDDEVDNFDDD